MKKTWKNVRPIVLDGAIARVPLADGSEAIIDAEDAPKVASWNWHVKETNRRNYASVGRRTNAGQFIPLSHQVKPPPPGMLNDHKDGDTRNNRKTNLRPATHKQNAHNRRKANGCTSRFKGVSFRRDRGTWLATIRTDGRLLKIGTFHREEDAARAYDAKARELFGEFARLNFNAPEGE